MESRAEVFRSISGLPERRRWARYTVAIGVPIDTDSGKSCVLVLNLCEGGMAVHTEARIKLDSVIRLRWQLNQQGGPLETEGIVVWVDKVSARFGIRFQNLSEHAGQSICHWAKLAQQSLNASQAKLGRDTFVGRRTVEALPPVRVPLPAEANSPEHISRIPAIASEARGSRRWWAPVAAVAVLMCLILMGVGAYWGVHAKDEGGPGLAVGTGVPMLRLAGSNTIGVKLAPALAQAFLKQLGAREIQVLPGANAEEESVRGILPGFLPGGSNQIEIQIAAHGSATAFEDLMHASCDIGMASRKITPKEISKLSALGNLSAPASEHLLGLDGIAVIVNSSNLIETLTADQLAGIFSGTVVDWSQVSGQHGKINVYAPDDRSGTYDTFKTLALGSKRLVDTARRFEDSRALSDAIAGDHNGIGIVGLPYILNAKSIAVAERGAIPFKPNRLTVGTEDYLLSRRLYLYTAANPENKYVRKFVEFALSRAGQDVVGDVGFIAQNVTSEKSVISPNAPYEYRRLTQGAGRLSLDFRFLPGFTVLDSKAMMDLDRVVSFLADSGFSGNDVMLLGFTDNTGDRQANFAISQSRARLVAEEFTQRGLKPAIVKGFGPVLPVGANDSDQGRERNRRVEIWLKQAQCAAPRTARDPG